MPRFPHELRRDGLFSSTWTLKGPLIQGTFKVPSHDRAGVYQGRGLRIEFRPGQRRANIEFSTPMLSRGGDIIRGKVRIAGTTKVVHISGRGTNEEGVDMPILTAGFMRRKMVIVAPHGEPVASLMRHSGHFDIDIPEGPFSSAARADPERRGKARLYEAAIVMLLAARIELERRSRAAMAGAAAGSAAGAAAATAGHRRRGGPGERRPDD